MLKIESITIEHMPDETPDFSTLGEYTDNLEPGVIIRREGEFYEKVTDTAHCDDCSKDFEITWETYACPECGGYLHVDHDMPVKGRTFRGFKPYAGGEEVGTKEYYTYGMRDFERMEAYNSQQWSYMGIQAKAVISYEIGQGHRRLETLTSGGLWGIESDAGDEYITEVETEQLEDLKGHLEAFGVDCSEWDTVEINRP